MDFFKGWFKNHFLQQAVSAQPLLLLLDGHNSHHNPEAIRLSKDNDVILFTLLPHTTHEMQPLDTAVFAAVKMHWRDTCHRFMQQNPGKVITEYQFSPLLAEAWLKAMSPSSIIDGFRGTGIYPYNPETVLHKVPSIDPTFNSTTAGSACNSATTSPSSDPITASCSFNSTTSDSALHNHEYSAEEEERSQTRYEEYMSWLESIILKQFQKIATSCHLPRTLVTLLP